MNMIYKVIADITIVSVFTILFFSISALLYVQFGLLKQLFHDKLNWHQPTDHVRFDGVSHISTCKHCGKPIVRDSQGNWFVIK